MPVIAVTGPSGSGKTSLARLLHAVLQHEFEIAVLHQDQFFWPSNWARQAYAERSNMDQPDAVDFERLRASLRSARDGDTSRLVLVEGFLLLQDEPLMAMVDGVLFLDASKESCLARRLARRPRTADEIAGCSHYYETCVWPGHLRYTQPALAALAAAQQQRHAKERLRHAGLVAVRTTGRETAADVPPLVQLDGEAPLVEVLPLALEALPKLLPAHARPAATAVAASASTSGVCRLCCLLQSSGWRALVEDLPQLISRTRSDEAARSAIGLAIAPLAAAAVRSAATAAAAAAVGGGFALRALTLLCRLMRNSCAGQPCVQRTLRDEQILDAVQPVIATVPAAAAALAEPGGAERAGGDAAAQRAECSLAAAQLVANLCVGQSEAQAEVWARREELIRPMLSPSAAAPSTQCSKLQAAGLSLLLSCVRAEAERLGQLLRVEEGGADGASGAAPAAAASPGAAHTELEAGGAPFAALWLRVALDHLRPQLEDEAVGAAAAAARVGVAGAGGAAASSGAGSRPAAAAAPSASGDSSWSLLLLREAVGVGLLLRLLDAAASLDSGDEPLCDPTPISYVAVAVQAVDAITEVSDSGVVTFGPAAPLSAAASVELVARLRPLLASARHRGFWCTRGWREVEADEREPEVAQPEVAHPRPATPPAPCWELSCLLKVAGDLALGGAPPFDRAAPPREDCTAGGLLDVVATARSTADGGLFSQVHRRALPRRSTCCHPCCAP